MTDWVCANCSAKGVLEDLAGSNCPDCDRYALKSSWSIYVNVYLEVLEYGGPEEGGWYYRSGEPIESVLVNNLEEAGVTKTNLEAKYPNEGRRPISSVLSEGEYCVRLENHFARAFPESRPYYS